MVIPPFFVPLFRTQQVAQTSSLYPAWNPALTSLISRKGKKENNPQS
jgi:hypothetical protein